MKAILLDRQLWDIVEGTDDPPKVEKNDMALRLIKYSLRSSMIGEKIRYMTTTKTAWDALAAICALPKSKLHIGISRSLSKMHMIKHI